MKRTLNLLLAALFILSTFNVLFAGRYYMPEIARWATPDPALQQMHPNQLLKIHNGMLLSTSPYVYTFNNPLRYTDPNGETPWDLIDIGFAIWSVKDAIADPTAGNIGWATLDVITAAAPIVPSSGYFRRGAKAVNKAIDLIEGGDKVKEATQAVVKAGKTVIGKYPEYLKLSDKLSANRFNIPTKIWNKMSKAERWQANVKFLDRAIARGDEIILSNPVKNIDDVSGTFRKELDYLIEQGYRLSEDGSRMIK